MWSHKLWVFWAPYESVCGGPAWEGQCWCSHQFQFTKAARQGAAGLSPVCSKECVSLNYSAGRNYRCKVTRRYPTCYDMPRMTNFYVILQTVSLKNPYTTSYQDLLEELLLWCNGIITSESFSELCLKQNVRLGEGSYDLKKFKDH